MQKIITICLLMLMLLTPLLSFAATKVRGYTKSNGTYVNSYYRSSPNSYRYDNYSTKGNYNPYTGSKGYKTYYKY